MEEQKKTWIPACARMTRNWPSHSRARRRTLDPRVREDDRRKSKKEKKEEGDRRGTTYDVRRWAAGRDRRIFSSVSNASRPELASMPRERLWSA